MANLVNYSQIEFDPAWIDETGFMVGALNYLPAERMNEILIGYQILREMPANEPVARRRHTLRNARAYSQSAAWGQRPMLFQIGYQKVVQEMKGILDQPSTSKRTPYNARAVITPHQIVVRAVGADWEHLDTAVAARECWLPYRHIHRPQERRWLQIGHVPDDGENWLPLFEDGYHRACLHLISLLFRNVGVALHQSFMSQGNLEGLRSVFLAIEKDHEACRRDVEMQTKRTRELLVADHGTQLHRQLQQAVRQSRYAQHLDELMDVLKTCLRLYYEYCLETGIRLPLDQQSPIVVSGAFTESES